MRNRILATYLKRDAKLYPVVTLTGPRQSGKTTLAKAVFPKHAYVSLEDLELRSFATNDPRGFLARFSEGVILDEVQRVPSLFSYLQGVVDADPRPGRYILTGSHNFLLMKEISQSLAGRSGILHLLPFNRSELEGHESVEPISPQDLFRGSKTDLSLWNTVYTGLYPRIHDRKIPPDIWLSDYIQTYLERDVRLLINIGDLETFGRFLKLCAGRAGQLLNYSSLATDAGISVDTARRWISILQTSFLIFLLPPHHRNFNKRVVKCPKLFFYDTGLVCRLLGLTSAAQLEQHPLRGPVFENYIVAEIAKTYFHHRRIPPIFFWRDRHGHEVDLIVEKGSDLHAVEIKSSQTVTGEMIEGFRWWQNLYDQSGSKCTLLYGGADAYERSGIAIRPWFST